MTQQRYVQRRGANHGLHIVLSVLTCGIWAITGWPIAAIMGRRTVTTIPAPQLPPPGYYPPPAQQPYQAPPFYGQQPPPPPQGWPPHQ